MKKKIILSSAFLSLGIVLCFSKMTFTNAMALDGCGGETGDEALYDDHGRECADGSTVTYCDCGSGYCLVEQQGVCAED